NGDFKVQDADSNVISFKGSFDSNCILSVTELTSPPPQANQSSDTSTTSASSASSNHHNAGKISGIVIGTLIGALLSVAYSSVPVMA
ncbi:hypothetical protein V5O48_014346, partial [Marasmius crinis-equi]